MTIVNDGPNGQRTNGTIRSASARAVKSAAHRLPCGGVSGSAALLGPHGVGRQVGGAGGCSRRASDGAPAGPSSPRAMERRRPTGCRQQPHALPVHRVIGCGPTNRRKPTLLTAAMQRYSKAQRAHICDQRTYDVRSAHECSRAYSHTTGGDRPADRKGHSVCRAYNGLAAQ
jgi:hypothetical protein